MVGTISLDVIGCQLSRNVNYLVFVLVCLCACVHPVRIELNRNRSLSVCPLALLFRLIYLFHSWRSFIVIIMIIEANRASSQTIASVLCVCRFVHLETISAFPMVPCTHPKMWHQIESIHFPFTQSTALQLPSQYRFLFFLSFPFLPHPHHHHNSIRLSHSIGSNWSVGCKWWTITIRRIRCKINNLFTIKWTISNTIAFFFYESNGDRGYYCSYLPFALITSDAQSEKRVPLVSLKWLLCQLVSVMHSRLLLYSLATILFGSIHFVSFCTCFIAW